MEIEQSSEKLLRQRLGEVTGDQYDYIYLEGGSGGLSRQLHSTLAKLHVALNGMFVLWHLQKADETVIRAAGDLRRQICETVAPPKSAPLRFAFAEPQRFNDRVVMDVFFIWARKGSASQWCTRWTPPLCTRWRL